MVDVTLADTIAEYSKYSGWPELKESFMAGKVRAAYLLAPMVMDLVDSGVPAKIVALGHRSGAVIMVRSDSPAKSIRDLRGRRVAIPSRFAVDHLFVRAVRTCARPCSPSSPRPARASARRRGGCASSTSASTRSATPRRGSARSPTSSTGRSSG